MIDGRRAALQAALFARHGQPVALAPDVIDDDGTAVVRVYAVGSLEAATAYVLAERVEWGNLARAECRPRVGWVVVVDLRDRVQDMKRDAAAAARVASRAAGRR